jgi:hypothetical protein
MNAPSVSFPDLTSQGRRLAVAANGADLLRSNDQWILLIEEANLHHFRSLTARHR